MSHRTRATVGIAVGLAAHVASFIVAVLYGFEPNIPMLIGVLSVIPMSYGCYYYAKIKGHSGATGIFALKYPARWRVLITNHIPTEKQRKWRGIRYSRWIKLAEIHSRIECSLHIPCINPAV